MGADFISIVLVGPLKLSLSKALRRKAEKKMEKLSSVVCRLKFLQETLEISDPTTSQWAQNELEELIKDNLKPHEEIEDVLWAVAYKDNPGKFIDELFEAWDGTRDNAWRIDPTDKKRKIWTAGNMTWGDEPDGFGYQTMKHADAAGLLDIFGIE